MKKIIKQNKTIIQAPRIFAFVPPLAIHSNKPTTPQVGNTHKHTQTTHTVLAAEETFIKLSSSQPSATAQSQPTFTSRSSLGMAHARSPELHPLQRRTQAFYRAVLRTMYSSVCGCAKILGCACDFCTLTWMFFGSSRV